MERTRIVIVDDDEATRRSLARTISSAGWSVEGHGSGHDFLDSDSLHSSACILLDLRMPLMSGLSVQAELCLREIFTPIVFISGFPDVSAAVRAVREGAFDFLQKPFSEHEILSVIERAVAHGRKIDREMIQRRRSRRLLDDLSDRQRQVLELLMKGFLNKQIADELGISERTVEFHRHACMAKMRAASFVDLVKTVLLAELVQPIESRHRPLLE